jgi:hypothetical protein
LKTFLQKKKFRLEANGQIDYNTCIFDDNSLITLYKSL